MYRTPQPRAGEDTENDVKYKYITRDTLEGVKTRLTVPGSWWSRALWRGKQWRKHRTSGSWSTPASSHLGNYKKDGRMRKLHTCGETQTLAMSSKRRKYCWHVVCCDNWTITLLTLLWSAAQTDWQGCSPECWSTAVGGEEERCDHHRHKTETKTATTPSPRTYITQTN